MSAFRAACDVRVFRKDLVSEMLRCVVQWAVSDISKAYSAFIFRVQESTIIGLQTSLCLLIMGSLNLTSLTILPTYGKRTRSIKCVSYLFTNCSPNTSFHEILDFKKRFKGRLVGLFSTEFEGWLYSYPHMSSFIHLQRRHAPHRRARPLIAKEGTITKEFS